MIIYKIHALAATQGAGIETGLGVDGLAGQEFYADGDDPCGRHLLVNERIDCYSLFTSRICTGFSLPSSRERWYAAQTAREIAVRKPAFSR